MAALDRLRECQHKADILHICMMDCIGNIDMVTPGKHVIKAETTVPKITVVRVDYAIGKSFRSASLCNRRIDCTYNKILLHNM